MKFEESFEKPYLEGLFDKLINLYYPSEDIEDTKFVETVADLRIISSVMKDVAETISKQCDIMLKDMVDTETTWSNKEYGKKLELSIKKNSKIDPKIVDELSDEECRKGFTVTAKVIESIGRSDLLEKYKSITESKTITLRSLKE